MRGLMLNLLTDLATSLVISTNSSTFGSMFTVVSAKNIGPCLVNIKYIPATLLVSASVPIICNAGRMVSG